MTPAQLEAEWHMRAVHCGPDAFVGVPAGDYIVTAALLDEQYPGGGRGPLIALWDVTQGLENRGRWFTVALTHEQASNLTRWLRVVPGYDALRQDLQAAIRKGASLPGTRLS